MSGLSLTEGRLYTEGGTFVGFVYEEDGLHLWYPPDKSGYFSAETLGEIADFLVLSDEEIRRAERVRTDCAARRHTFVPSGQGIHTCSDCGEPGFWVPNRGMEFEGVAADG